MNFNDRVSIDLADNGVAQVRFTRGDKMNALDPAQFEAVLAAGEALRDMPGLRVAVLSGEGRAFCAGLDTSSFGGEPAGSAALVERTHGNANRAQEAAMTWRKCPVPVIAAVHGVCFGGGLQIASGADANSIRTQAIAGGMRTLRQDALAKLSAGITTPEEVVRVTRAV